MPFAGTSHRPLVGVGAVLGVLALIGGAVAWWAGGASAAPSRPVVAAGLNTVPEPTASSSTTSSSTSTTSSTTSTSTPATSSTVKPKPVTTTTPVARSTPPTAPPATAPPVAQAVGPSPAERCAAARLWVAQRGLALPAGWGFRCPGPAVTGGASRWGVACWNCEGTGSWIAIDVARIGSSDATLRHVIAHETCHAIEFVTLGLTTELTADLCAALHGAPRP